MINKRQNIELNLVDNVNEELYKNIDAIINTTRAISRALCQCVYLIDFHKNGILYVSDNPLFLCGHTTDDFKNNGYSILDQHISEEERTRLLEINNQCFPFFENNIPQKDKSKCYFTYDFHLTLKGKKKVLINHKLTPILLTGDGKIWIAMCIVSLSSRTTSRDLEIHIEGMPQYWKYNLKKHKWEKVEMIQLKEEEKLVLQLSSQGYTMSDIAGIMCKSIDTIKSYKRALFNKIGTKNLIGALNYARLYKLF